MNAPITALAPWYGSKRTLAPRIIEQLGPHAAYWEPFCGSMAVLLAKEPARAETVNDLHGDLVNLARVIQDEDACPRLYWRLRRTLTSEALFREAKARLLAAPAPDSPDVARAFDFFVVSWQGVNGIAGCAAKDTGFAKRYTSTGGHPATRFVSCVESLPDWHERLRPVQILSSCGLAVLEQIEDRAGTAVFVDPPYFSKSNKYEHDFAAEDHERLAAALNRLKLTRVVLSYYAHPELDRLYAGWTRIEATMTKGLVNAGRREAGRVLAPEVLLVNGPALPAKESA